MKNLLDKIFPTLSDELIIVISLIIGLLVTASLILFLVKKISPKTNISELAARTRSWWIMAGMFIGAVFISYNISSRKKRVILVRCSSGNFSRQ
jgi:phosphatidate cytidylyltransferase